MENTVKERIKEFIKYKNISVRKFEILCNLSNGYINGINQTIMPNKISAISLKFPDLNTAWLLTGKGEMLLNNKSNVVDIEVQNKTTKNFTDLYKDMIKVKRVVDMLDKNKYSDSYEDICVNFDMINACIEHYSLLNKSQYIINAADKKEMLKKAQQILNIENEALKIITPYKNVIYELFKKLLDFDRKHDNCFVLDNEDEKLIIDTLK